MIYCIINYLNVQKRYKPVTSYDTYFCEKHPVTAKKFCYQCHKGQVKDTDQMLDEMRCEMGEVFSFYLQRGSLFDFLQL